MNILLIFTERRATINPSWKKKVDLKKEERKGRNNSIASRYCVAKDMIVNTITIENRSCNGPMDEYM